MSKLLILNGPNLNLLGKREPGVYGNDSLEQINSTLVNDAKSLDLALDFFQSNQEGELVERINQAAGQQINYILFNPAASPTPALLCALHMLHC